MIVCGYRVALGNQGVVRGIGNMLNSSRTKLLLRSVPLGDEAFLSLWLAWWVLSLGAHAQRVVMNPHPLRMEKRGTEGHSLHPPFAHSSVGGRQRVQCACSGGMRSLCLWAVGGFAELGCGDFRGLEEHVSRCLSHLSCVFLSAFIAHIYSLRSA